MTNVLCRTLGAALLLLNAAVAVHAQATPSPESRVAAPSNSSAGLRPSYGGTPVDVLTYHNDRQRSGWNPTETDLTQASVSSGKFGLLQTLAVDGVVLAQPLLVSGFEMPDGSLHDILVVVTGHNTVYAFDAQTYAVLWQRSFGPPQLSADVGCNQVDPEYGILATPVINRQGAGQATLYLVSNNEASPTEFHTRLHALNLANGLERRPAALIDPRATMSDGSTLSFDAKDQWVRAGLVWANDSIYLALSSKCDQNSAAISGWMQRYNTDLKLMKSLPMFRTPAGTQLAAIWMSGFAPAVDGEGNLFAVTGNGNFSHGGKDWGESVVKMPPSLSQVSDWFTPKKYRELNSGDTDFAPAAS